MGVRKCVITGAGGLIGSHLIPELRPSWEIHALSRQRPDAVEKGENLRWYNVDLAGQPDFRVLPNEVDSVVYLAQSEYFRDFPDRAVDTFEVNTSQVVRLLDWARRAGVRRFIFASSGGVYGTGHGKMSEEIEIPAGGNLGFYLSTKLCSEILTENYAPFMSTIILRFFFVYGAGQRRSMLVPRLVDSVREGKVIRLEGESGVLINPTHVADGVYAIIRALELEGNHKINVGGPEVLSLRRIGEIIGTVVGKSPIFKVEASASPRNVIADTARMSELLQPPTVKFEVGVKDVL
jgi:UDP-glucose 4-epimerase